MPASGTNKDDSDVKQDNKQPRNPIKTIGTGIVVLAGLVLWFGLPLYNDYTWYQDNLTKLTGEGWTVLRKFHKRELAVPWTLAWPPVEQVALAKPELSRISTGDKSVVAVPLLMIRQERPTYTTVYVFNLETPRFLSIPGDTFKQKGIPDDAQWQDIREHPGLRYIRQYAKQVANRAN